MKEEGSSPILLSLVTIAGCMAAAVITAPVIMTFQVLFNWHGSNFLDKEPLEE